MAEKRIATLPVEPHEQTAAAAASGTGQRVRPVRNASYLAAANLAAKVFSFIFLLYLNSHLKPGVVGNYYIVLSYVGLFGIVTDLGLGTLAVRDVTQDRSLAVRYISNLLAVRTLLSALAVVFIVILMPPYISADLHNAVYAYALVLIPLAVTNTLQLVFQFSEQLVYSAVLSVATSALISGLSIMALFTGHHVLSLMIVFTAVTTANTLIMAWLVYTRFLPARLEFDPAWWPMLVRSAIPFAVLTLLNVVYNYADRQILTALKCGHTTQCIPVGEYGTAYRPLDILVLVFVGSINAATLPAFNRVVGESRAALARLVRSSSTLALTFGVPVALFGTFFAREALHILAPGQGNQYNAAAPALAMLIWTFPCVLVLTMIYNALYAVHRQRIVTVAFGITLVFNVALNLLLIPHFSYYASAALTVASEVLNGIIAFVALRQSIGPLGLTVPALKMALIAAVTALILWALHPYTIFVGLPAGVIVIVLGLRLLRVLGPTEGEILGRVPLVGRYAGLIV